MKFREPKPAQADYSDTNEPLTQELFEHLVRRANRGDQKAAVRLRQILQEHPHIWKDIGDLAKHAKRSLIDLIANGNPVLNDSLGFQLEDLTRSLRNESSDQTLEGLVIDHILVCWLELYFVRTAAMQPQRRKTDRRFWDRRLDKAFIRFHLAVRDLAALRGVIGDDAGVVPFPVINQDEP